MWKLRTEAKTTCQASSSQVTASLVNKYQGKRPALRQTTKDKATSGCSGWYTGSTSSTPLHPAGAPTIPEQSLAGTALAARDVPGFALVALGIDELIVLAPAQHEAQAEGHE